MKVEDNRCVYEDKDTFSRFSKSICYKVLSFACLSVNKASWVQGGVIVIVSLAVGITIAKFIGLGECCLLVAFSALYVYYFLNILSVYYCIWTSYMNILWKYIAEEMAARVQALDTRPFLSSHADWVQGYIWLCSLSIVLYILLVIHLPMK